LCHVLGGKSHCKKGERLQLKTQNWQRELAYIAKLAKAPLEDVVAVTRLHAVMRVHIRFDTMIMRILELVSFQNV
jgi:hypothetical protein